MSLKAKIEAVIYASEEPVTLSQLVGLLGEEAQAELDRAAAAQQTLLIEAELEAAETEPVLGPDFDSVGGGGDDHDAEHPQLGAHGNPVVGERPKLLDQPVVQLAVPLPRQERNNRRAAMQKLAAVPPDAVLGIGQGNPFGIAGVPAVLGGTHLLPSGLQRERR